MNEEDNGQQWALHVHFRSKHMAGSNKITSFITLTCICKT